MKFSVMFFRFLLLTALLTVPLSNSYALKDGPRPIVKDKRIRLYTYEPDQIYTYIGHFRYQSTIEFAPDEEVKTITMGDSASWQIEPLGNRLFIKPVDEYATTNMTVMTNKRVYHFELYAKEASDIRDSDLVFILRFQYPDAGSLNGIQQFSSNKGPDLTDPTKKYNFNYTISGTERIAPSQVFDDGQFTYFKFNEINADLPAFFMVNADGSEALVNYRMTGDYLVVERVTSQFTLRYGNEATCVFNESNPLIKVKPKKKNFIDVIRDGKS